jgi:hypothetical protein
MAEELAEAPDSTAVRVVRRRAKASDQPADLGTRIRPARTATSHDVRGGQVVVKQR